MASIKISVINASTVVKDTDVPPVVEALQVQVHDHFAPIWGVDADLKVVAKGQKPPAGTWWLTILDNSDQAGALGYHDLTTDGLPIGKVFARTDQEFGEDWAVTASHELLELLADPNINLTVFEQTDAGGRIYAYEVCDACEAEKFAYKINGIKVSDFVFPAWFESFRKPGSTKFDYQKRIKKPFQLLAGGYIGIYDVAAGTGWTQLTASRHNFRARAPVGSRRERRTIPSPDRIPSTV
jgi:hypothetical protein